MFPACGLGSYVSEALDAVPALILLRCVGGQDIRARRLGTWTLLTLPRTNAVYLHGSLPQ